MNQLKFIIAIVSILSIVSCTKDSHEILPINNLEDNGFSTEINNLVPDSIITIMENLGMPIYRGGNPPLLNAGYLTEPLTLMATNRSSDNIGQIFEDYVWTFSNCNLEDLTVVVDYQSDSGDLGNGVGSFISGEGNEFTVFVEAINIDNDTGSEASVLYCLSGTLGADSITDFYLCLIMLDDNGDPFDTYIEVGQGRVIIDGDSVSPKV